MLVRKYQGKSLKEIEEQCRRELGPDSLILNIREIKPKGLKKLFRASPVFEAIAAVEDHRSPSKETKSIDSLQNQDIDEDLESLKEVKTYLMKQASKIMSR